MCFSNVKRQALARPKLASSFLSKSKLVFLQISTYKKHYNYTKFEYFSFKYNSNIYFDRIVAII